jgi:DNA-binding response OmpR family regulator
MNAPSLARILVVDDDESLNLLVQTTLEKQGYQVDSCTTGKEALKEITRSPPALVVLDLRLPDMDGREICQKLRAHPRTANLPILMMTNLTSEEDRVRGFEMGADDYLPKPVSYRELALRIRALLHRFQTGQGPEPITDLLKGPLRLDLARRQLYMTEEHVVLTSTEFNLIEYLIQNEGRVVSRSELLEQVWGTSGSLTTRRVDTYVQRLRSKLGMAGAYLHTHRGDGYRFELSDN